MRQRTAGGGGREAQQQQRAINNRDTRAHVRSRRTACGPCKTRKTTRVFGNFTNVSACVHVRLVLCASQVHQVYERESAAHIFLGVWNVSGVVCDGRLLCYFMYALSIRADPHTFLQINHRTDYIRDTNASDSCSNTKARV